MVLNRLVPGTRQKHPWYSILTKKLKIKQKVFRLLLIKRWVLLIYFGNDHHKQNSLIFGLSE